MLARKNRRLYRHVAVRQRPGACLGKTVAGVEDCVSVYELNRAVHAIYIDRDRAIAFRDGDNSVLTDFDLTADERQALAARDFPRLWALHVHPMILFHLSAVMNPREWYMQNVIPHIRDVPNHWYDYYKDQYAPGDGA
jgi:hypothetical protein